MSLKESRIRFIEFSGRYDLVIDTIDYQDAGADKFIHAGQRWLDRRFVVAKQIARWYTDLIGGQWYAIVPSLRAAHAVWMSSDKHGKWQLEKLQLEELRKEIPNLPESTGGRPLVWAPSSLRTIPEEIGTIVVDVYGSTTYVQSGDHYNNQGLLWAPPTGEAFSLEVLGNFYQPFLTSDDARNYWTEEEQHALTLSACRALEQSYRNMQGMLDWEVAVQNELLGLELDYTDQESTGVDHMEGWL